MQALAFQGNGHYVHSEAYIPEYTEGNRDGALFLYYQYYPVRFPEGISQKKGDRLSP